MNVNMNVFGLYIWGDTALHPTVVYSYIYDMYQTYANNFPLYLRLQVHEIYTQIIIKHHH